MGLEEVREVKKFAFFEVGKNKVIFLNVALVLTILLQSSGLILNFGVAPSAAAISNCNTSTQFAIDAKQNSVFYFDSGTTITSGYTAYEITNKGTSGTYWAKIQNFTSTKLGLATYENATRPLGTLSNGASKLAFWYLTATGTTNTTQSHDIVIYSSDPSSGGGTAVCKLTKGFNSVASTISASANKLTSVTYDPLPTPNSDGSSTFTSTVKGQTGNIGQGPTSTYDVNLNPATNAAFAAGNFRLVNTSYVCTGGTPTTGTLYIANACEGNYTAVFTFQYLSSSLPSGSSNTLSPIMQISSGTQMKHTDTPSFTIAAIGTAATPQITTSAPIVTSATSATLRGTLDVGTFTSLFFCISTTSPATHFASNCSPTYTASLNSGYYTYDITTLTGSTTYYYEILGVSSGTTYYGGLQSFKTPSASVVSTTDLATSIGTTTATLNGYVSDTAVITSGYFLFTTISPGSLSGHPDKTKHLDPSTSTQTSNATYNQPAGTFSLAVTSLSPNKVYYFELVALDSSTAKYLGGVETFTTTAATGYLITFNPNGGTLASNNALDTATVSSGLDALLSKPDPDPSRTNYDFVGWNTDQNATIALDTAIVAAAPFTLYAIWSPAPVITFYPNSGILASGNLTDTASVLTGLDALDSKPTPNPSRSGYTFLGWNTSSTATSALSSYIVSGAANLYAVWSRNEPIYLPPPPMPPSISSISKSPICSLGETIVIRGENLANVSVKVNGLIARILDSANSYVTVAMPEQYEGLKTIVVTNPDGSASTSILYTFADTPIIQPSAIPQLYVNREFSYAFEILNATTFAIVGNLPPGVVFDKATQILSGIPTSSGNFTFALVVSNICGSVTLNITLNVDKEIPEAFSCTVTFPSKNSNIIQTYKLPSLIDCLNKIKDLDPNTVDPLIFLSGGNPSNEPPGSSPTATARYNEICDVLLTQNLIAQIITGVFFGPPDEIEIIVYWPVP